MKVFRFYHPEEFDHPNDHDHVDYTGEGKGVKDHRSDDYGYEKDTGDGPGVEVLHGMSFKAGLPGGRRKVP